MRTSKPIARIVVDANPILSAVIGGAARRVFQAHSSAVGELATTEHTVREVIEYIPELAQKPRLREAGVTEGDLYFALIVAPLTIYPRVDYAETWDAAREQIEARDPDDVDLLALALKLEAPIWTNDQDFEETDVRWWTTAQLLEELDL